MPTKQSRTVSTSLSLTVSNSSMSNLRSSAATPKCISVYARLYDMLAGFTTNNSRIEEKFA